MAARVYDDAMRIRRGVVAVLVLSACGNGGGGPDVTKMKPDEACRVIARRAFQCRATIVRTVSASLTRLGATDDVVSQVTFRLSRPLPCDQVDARELEPLRSCYDHDCDRLASCFDAIMSEGLRPAGGGRAPSPPPPEPAVATPPPPAPAVATPPPPAVTP